MGPPPAGSAQLITKQDQATLLIRVERSCLQTLDSRAADRVIDEGVAEVGHAQGLGDHAAGRVEGVGTQDEAGLAVLLKGDPVVHTARRARASITDRRDQEIDIVGDPLQDLRIGDPARVALA